MEKFELNFLDSTSLVTTLARDMIISLSADGMSDLRGRHIYLK